MAQLGKAFIEVRADLSKFPTELRVQLEKALKEGTAGVSFEDFEKKAGAAGKEGGKRLADELDKSGKARSKRSGEKIAEDVGLGLFGTLKKIFSGSSGGSSGGGFLSNLSDVFKGFTKTAEDGFSKLSDTGSKIGEIGGKIGSAFSAIGSGITTGLYTLAVPAVGALLALVVQLSGALFALPAAIAPLIAVFATLKIATEGVGSAISDGFSAKNAADIKKYNEELKGLAPSARSVVKEIVGLKGAFEVIKNSTQQAFFAPLIGAFSQLKSTLLPALNTGFATAGAALGRFTRGFLDLFSKPEIIKAITATFATLARILDTVAPAAQALFASVFSLVQAGLPFIQQFSTYLATAGEKLAGLLTTASGSGKIAGFIAAAAQPFKELIRLVGAFGSLFFTIFANSDVRKAGNDFLNYLTESVGLLAKFFKSAEGKKVLKDFADAIEHSGQVLLVVAGLVIALVEAVHYLNAGLALAVKAVGAFFAFVGGLAVTAGKAVIDFFKAAFSAIADFFTKDIPKAYRAVVDFFEGLPKRAGDGIRSFRTEVINGIEGALRDVIDSVARNIGHVIGVILAAPQIISRGLTELGRLIKEAFVSSFEFAQQQVQLRINNTIAFFSALPHQVSSIFNAVYHAIVDWISSAVTNARDFVVSGFNAIVNFFGELPGKIKALGPKLLHAAEDLGRQIGNGLKNIGNFASDIGKSILNDLKSGLNHIINSINAGINDVGGNLHLKLPNLPHLARGGVIDSPTVALLGEGSKREVVVPLTDPARAQQLAQQSGLTQILAKGAGTPIVNITAILGTGQILEILDQRVTSALDGQGNELAYARS
jgi:hypothetical protein